MANNVNFNKEKYPEEGFYKISEIGGGKIFWIYTDGKKEGKKCILNFDLGLKERYAFEDNLSENYMCFQKLIQKDEMRAFIKETFMFFNSDLKLLEESRLKEDDSQIILILLSKKLQDEIREEALDAIERGEPLSQILTQTLKNEPSKKFIVQGYTDKEKEPFGSFLYKHDEEASKNDIKKMFKLLKLSPQTFYNFCKGCKEIKVVQGINIIPIPKDSVAFKEFDRLRYVSTGDFHF